jgi:hypothetical protein
MNLTSFGHLIFRSQHPLAEQSISCYIIFYNCLCCHRVLDFLLFMKKEIIDDMKIYKQQRALTVEQVETKISELERNLHTDTKFRIKREIISLKDQLGIY